MVALDEKKITISHSFSVSLMALYTHFSGLGWSYPCDLWSVGCILVELCSVSFFFFLVL